MTVRFSTSHGIVPVEAPLATNGNAGFTGDSIDMALYNHVTLLFLFAAAYDGGGILTLNAGEAVGGTEAVVTFEHRTGSAAAKAATADVLGAPVTAVGTYTCPIGLASRLLVCEVDTQDMWITNVQYRWLTASLSNAASAGEISCVAILSEPRYAEAVMPTAI